MNFSIIFDTDSYKVSHWVQYPPGTQSMFSYIESRGGLFKETVFFGLQYFIKKYLEGCVVTKKDVEKAAEIYKLHGIPFNKDGWMYIAVNLEGKLPVRIRAVPEGSVIPVSNVLVTIESLDPKCFWITSWIETMLVRLWYPINVATISYNAKKLIKNYLDKTCDNPDSEILFKLHDFGSRGVSSQESAAIGGAAHLLNFLGSDTIVGVLLANEIYNCKMSGFSIPATEHSTITSWGEENEAKAYENMLNQYGRINSILAVVSDSYDIYNACENIWGGILKQKVIDSGATVVIRPDSGDPETVVRNIIKILGNKFGYAINNKGYKVLNNVRIIQGDGVNLNSINNILKGITEDQFSTENIAFGMGGALLQQHNRDTQKFAMKCCSITDINNKDIDIYKNPVTDSGKSSKRGRLDLVKTVNSNIKNYETIKLNKGEIENPNSVMRTVFENGNLLIEDSFDDIRERIKMSL